MKYRIEISAPAEAEIKAAYLWIHRDSPGNAKRWRERLLTCIRTLQRQPDHCPLAPEATAFKQEIRQLLYGKRRGVYRILFTVAGNVVQILHVRHGARQFLEPEL